MTDPAPRLLMIEDDTRLITALGPLLVQQGLEVAFATTGADARAKLQEAAFDVIFVDLGLPDVDGVALIRELRAAGVEAPMVVLTAATAESRILAAIRAGARGYLFKEDMGARLAAAAREAMDGGAPMSRAVARLVLDALGPRIEPAPPLVAGAQALTAREREVVDLLAEGCTYEQTAAALDVSINTVRTYVRSIYEKLSVGTKTEAVMAALRLGLVRPAERRRS